MMRWALSALALCAVSSGANAALTFNFGNTPNPVGTSHTYTAGSLQVVVTGYDANNQLTGLYSKLDGGDENGIGLANDPSGDHEIASGKGYVQLDVSKLFSLVSGATFFTGSTTDGETWQLFGSHVAGSPGTFLLSGKDELAHALPSFGTYEYYSFAAAPVGADAPRYNFLVGGLTVNQGVPEPATWAMMLGGFGVIGAAVRRRQRTAVTFA